jgi:hypothetical protein
MLCCDQRLKHKFFRKFLYAPFGKLAPFGTPASLLENLPPFEEWLLPLETSLPIL